MKHGNRGSLTQNEVQNISNLRPIRYFQAMCQLAPEQEMELENMAHVCCLLLQLRSRRVLPYADIIPFSRAFTSGKASHFQLESAREIS